MSSDSDNAESSFEALPQSTRAKIDSAFDVALASQDSNEPSSSNPRMPLVLVPHALVLLDLPSDDQQILGVCRSASSRGYLGRDSWRAVCAALLSEDAEDDEQDEAQDGMDVDIEVGSAEDPTRSSEIFVTGGGFIPDDPPGGGFLPDDDEPGTGGDGGGFIPDYDEAEESALESLSEGSSDEYVEPSSTPKAKGRGRISATTRKRNRSSSPPSTTRSTRKRPRRSEASSPPDSDLSPSKPKGKTRSGKGKNAAGKLSSSRQEEALHVFALFLGDIQSERDVLLKRRIMISDVQRVAKLLNEKIKAEEIMQMLEIFSTSPDKSVGWDDFQKIVAATGIC